MKFEIDYIEQLVKLVSDSELTELTLEDADKAIVIKKENTVVQAQTYMPQALAAPAALASAPQAAVEEKKEEAPKGKPVTSPMVGTFYMAASPGAKPLVEIGTTVSTGQVVCIIEAMKLMNEIESEVSGKVTQICVKDGEAVEYGQVLMYVE